MEETEFREIYEKYKADAYRLSYSYLRKPEDAEEAVHESFLALWKKPPRKIERAKSYLFSVVVRKSLDLLRKRAREAPPLDESQVAGSGDYGYLYAALDKLPEKDSGLLRLHYFAGLGLAEIAKARSMSVEAVKKAMERARNALKEII